MKKYKGIDGRIWAGRKCPDCQLIILKNKRDQVEIDYNINYYMRWGRWAEIQAKKIFEMIGYEVKLCRMSGPDLTITKDMEIKTVEVKIATKLKAGFMTCDAVKPARKNDDLIFLITKESEFFVDLMKDHLLVCNNSGFRALTKIYKTGGFLKIPC